MLLFFDWTCDCTEAVCRSCTSGNCVQLVTSFANSAPYRLHLESNSTDSIFPIKAAAAAPFQRAVCVEGTFNPTELLFYNACGTVLGLTLRNFFSSSALHPQVISASDYRP